MTTQARIDFADILKRRVRVSVLLNAFSGTIDGEGRARPGVLHRQAIAAPHPANNVIGTGCAHS